MILDSGDRRQFFDADGNPLGVRDMSEGKGRCDLMPLDVVADCYSLYFNEPNVFYPLARFTETGEIPFLVTALSKFLDKSTFLGWSDMFLAVSKHFEDGAKKYGENNWQKGLPVSCYIDSAIRHYFKYLRGDDDEPHDRAFVWNILCCIWTCKHKPEMNNYAPQQ